jgi:hypothetical protein
MDSIYNISVRYPATDRQLRSRLRGNVSHRVLGRWLNRASRLGKPGIVRLILDRIGDSRVPDIVWPSARSALWAVVRSRGVPIWKEPRAIQDRYFETVKILVDAGALRFQTNLPERPIFSLLFLAITQSTPRIVRFLVTREIRIYQRTRTSPRYVIYDALNFYEQSAAIALGDGNLAESARLLEMRREMNRALFNGRVRIPLWVFDEIPINRSNSNSNSNSNSARGGLSGITSNVPRAVSGNSRAASMVSNASYKNAIAFNEVNSNRGVYVRGSNQRPNKKIVRVYHRKTLAELLRRGSGTARHPFDRTEFTATSVRRVPMKK